MRSSDYDDIPGWDIIRERILKRDNYSCQHCNAKDKIISCKSTYYFPRYAQKKAEGGYTYYQPVVIKHNKYLAAIKDNIRSVGYKERKGGSVQVIQHASYYKLLSENPDMDGHKLKLMIDHYIKSNPSEIRNTKKLKTQRVKIHCQIHHKDKNRQNNHEDNLVTLCYFCHQNVHKREFPLLF